jgi:hypothetical protein
MALTTQPHQTPEKLRLTHCNANIFFNRQCLARGLTPSYASQIRIPRTNPAAGSTLKTAQIHRVKDELRYLHKKKQQAFCTLLIQCRWFG